MRVHSTKRHLGLGLFLVSGLVWATACGRTTIDFGVPEGNGGVGGTLSSGGAGAEGGFGGGAGVGAEGGSAGFGAQGGSGGAAEGGFGGDAGFGGSGAGGSGGSGDDCLAAATDECDVCTCDGCRDEWDSCQDDSGCLAIVECAKDAGCSGAQCLGPCGSVIQQNGGVTGQPAQLALGLGTCQSTTCGSDCNGGSGGSGGNGGNGGSGGSGGGGVIDCISCVGQNCPQAQECLLDSACRDGAICALTQCLGGGGGGGGFDFQCLLGCFDGDFNAALQAFNSVQCVFSSCGDDCGSLLGGGGGTPFGGGGGGTPFGGFGGGN